MVYVRRCLAIGMAGALLVLFAALGAGSVAADGNPPCYITALNSGTNTYCPPAPAAAAALAGVPYYPQPYVYSGVPYYAPYAYAGVPYYQPTGVVYGYTAAGPIIGYDGNGSALVYDVAGGTVDPYTIGPDGKYCEANSLGQCIES